MRNLFLKFCLYTAIIVSVSSGGCLNVTEDKNDVFGDSLYMERVPPQPGQETWKFIDYLKSPIWSQHGWESKVPDSGKADLSKGVTIKESFPDPKGLLTTAYEDLRLFFAAGNVQANTGEYILETLLVHDLEGEAFRLEINPDGCRILAGDIEGVRRGIFYLEDEMLRNRAPFLTLGNIQKEPLLKRRIARCFFGPIKRPPAMRDELMDDEDYYPDNYLNRLAHDGVNGLWLTIDFRDLVSTKFNPEAGKDASRRLDKLKRTVRKCSQYGIKTYIFTIEPRAWANQPYHFHDIQVLDNYPELGGVHRGNHVTFCPSSETAQQYLYQVVNKIFSEVPDLGGMINISHGERTTTCLSTIYQGQSFEGLIDCPRCSNKEPWQILHASLSAMKRGMHDANPEAELISWLYMSHPINPYPDDTFKLGDWVYDIPSNTPEGVIFQFNYESGVRKKEFGKLLIGGDYWISNPGPSYRFERLANSAREKGTRVSAKIQTSNSHEVATVPHVPVPSLLYRKFQGMQSLGVSHAMLGWYFGNDPGLMLKAAGILSFEPISKSEDDFLQRLASIYWKEEDVPGVVEAWKYFADGFENYPLSCMFQRYGPMHDGPVWPLLLKPADGPLTQTWLIGSTITRQPLPPSGDRIGECIGRILNHEEALELCRLMTTNWDKGLEIFDKLEKKYKNDPERILDIGVAKALGIQFRSGFNILKFYLLREKMFRMEGQERREILKQLVAIIKEELELNKNLIKLCRKDSRLGFHSEAEGYKYFPARIEWRMGELKKVLRNDVPFVKKLIRKNELLFPEYTGRRPQGATALAIPNHGSIWEQTGFEISEELQWQSFRFGNDNLESQWAASYDSFALYIIVSNPPDMANAVDSSDINQITIKLEPRRLWSSERYIFNTADENRLDKEVRIVKESGKKYFIVRIPFDNFRWDNEGFNPVRVDVIVNIRGVGSSSWRPSNPLIQRLTIGSDNPADLGWLVFGE